MERDGLLPHSQEPQNLHLVQNLLLYLRDYIASYSLGSFFYFMALSISEII